MKACWIYRTGKYPENKKIVQNGNLYCFCVCVTLFIFFAQSVALAQNQPTSQPQSTNSTLRIMAEGSDHPLIINGPCTNMGFEEGTFNGWTGNVQKRSVAGTNPVVPGFLQHCVMTPAMTDPLIPALSVVAPGKKFSVRVGNTATGGHLVTLSQTFKVLPDSSNLIFSYSYAVVLEDPEGAPGHDGLNRPYFNAQLFDENGNEISCAAYTVVVATGLEGFIHGCVDENNGNQSNTNTGCPTGAYGSDGSGVNTAVSTTTTTAATCPAAPGGGGGGGVGGAGVRDIYYKDWSTVAIPLNAYIGQNVTIKFTAADCTPGGHRGYAYVSGACMPLKISTPKTICSGLSTDTITGPAGFQTYAWTGPAGGFSGSATSQTIVATKGGTYKLTLTPFSNVPCPLVISYVVKEHCPPHSYTDTLCETIAGSGIASNVNLNTYNAMVTAPVVGSTVTAWHTALPASAGNQIANPSNFSAANGQKIYAVIAYTGGGDTSDLTFTINKLPIITFPDIPVLCAGGTPVTIISGLTPAGGVITGTANITSAGILTPSAPGNFNVKYKVISVQGCTDSTTKPVTIQPPPTVNAGPDQQFCSNAPNIKLNGTVTGSNAFIWAGGAGQFSPDNHTLITTYTPAATEISNGSVTLTLLTTDSLVCPSAKDKIVLSFEKIPVVNAGPDQTLCANITSIQLAGTVTNAKGGIWSGGHGTFSPAANNLSANYQPTQAEISAGSLVLTLINTGSVLCTPDTDQVQIKFTPLPIVNAGIDQTVCADKPNVVLNGSVIPPGTGGSWTNGSGTFAAGTTVLNTGYDPSPAEITQGIARLILTSNINGDCPPDKDTMVISIIPLPVIDLGPDLVNCFGTSITLTVKSIPNVVYTWKRNNSSIPDNTNSITFALLTGLTKYDVTAKDNHSCLYADSIQVTGIPIPQVILDDTTACTGTTLMLNARVANISNTVSLYPVYEWKKNGVSLNTNAPGLSVSQPGIYTIKISLGQCSNNDSAKVTFEPLPVPFLPGNFKFCSDDSLGIELNAGPGSKFLWKPSNDTTQIIFAINP
jgi:hypothetical protein